MPASPEQAFLLLVSASGRALAQSAARCGMPVVVLDLFNDMDVRALASASRCVAGRGGKFDGAKLLAAATELCPPEACAGVVYGSGLEGRPRLLERLARGRKLFGNAPATVAMLKDPLRFFPLLASLGIAHPPVRLEPPDDASCWLVKRIGGAGGSHVKPARSRHRARPHRYFQARQPGRTLSALFVADGRQAQLVGFNEQWHTAARRSSPYCYGGAVSRPAVPASLRLGVASMLDELVRATHLVGLNGMDFILDGETPCVLEINPRPTATIDLYDADVEGGLLALHLGACRGELPPISQSGGSRAHAIVYADRPLRVPAGMAWPQWCTDLPAGGSQIPAGAPVCSVHAAAPTSVEARELVAARRMQMETTLWERAA